MSFWSDEVGDSNTRGWRWQRELGISVGVTPFPGLPQARSSTLTISLGKVSVSQRTSKVSLTSVKVR